MMNNWIDIRKKIPYEIEGRELLFLDVESKACYVGFVESGEFKIFSNVDGCSYRVLRINERVTHWMILPELPEDA